MTERLERRGREDAPAGPPLWRPVVTLSFAQSLDGSLADQGGAPLRLSGPRALCLTHALRASNDAILVGINTVLNDDPQLTVRLVDGASPQPVVLDSRLRFPVTARLLSAGSCRPWVATTAHASDIVAGALTAAGVEVLTLPATDRGWIDLTALLARLRQRGVRRLMVEGGARVITSFLEAGLADHLVITISPCLVGGLRSVGAPERALPRLTNVRYEQVGPDMVVSGDLVSDQS